MELIPLLGMELFGDQFTCYESTPLDPRHTALLVVDMQYNGAHADFGWSLAMEKLAPGSMAYFNRRIEEVTVPTIRSLVGLFRSNDLPVVYLTIGSEFRDYRDLKNQRFRNLILDMEEKTGVGEMFWSGAAMARVRDELKPDPNELVINKTTFGAFNSTDIEEKLRSLGIECLVITGQSTNCCLETTARDAADRGFTCVLVDDGTCDYDEEMHKASLRAFKWNYGEILRDENEVRRALGMQERR